MVYMLKAKLIYLKDKQVLEKENGIMRFVGKPIDFAKKLKEMGFGLLHIMDVDAEKGLENNFDVYDKLGYIMNIELECNDERFFHKLLSIGTRVVVGLPAKIDLKKFSEHKKLLVGKIDSRFEGEIDGVNDLIIDKADIRSLKKYHAAGKRILVYAKDYKKEMETMVFAVIE